MYTWRSFEIVLPPTPVLKLREERDYEMRTKTRRRRTIELISDILASNLSLVFRILIE